MMLRQQVANWEIGWESLLAMHDARFNGPDHFTAAQKWLLFTEIVTFYRNCYFFREKTSFWVIFVKLGTLSGFTGFMIYKWHKYRNRAYISCGQCDACYFYRTQVSLGSDLWVRSLKQTPRGFWNLTDVTLADGDIKSILTDNANKEIQDNVAMHAFSQPGGEILDQF